MFAGFAERFTKEGDIRPGSRSAARAHKVAPGWAVTDEMVNEFREYLVERRVKVDEAAFKADLAFIKAMIRFEVDVDLFGVEEARRNLSKRRPTGQSRARLLRGSARAHRSGCQPLETRRVSLRLENSPDVFLPNILCRQFLLAAPNSAC